MPKKLLGDTPVRKSTYGLLFSGILSASLQNICCTLRLDFSYFPLSLSVFTDLVSHILGRVPN